MASFRSLLLGNQSDKEKADIVKAGSAPLPPPKTEPVSNIPPAQPVPVNIDPKTGSTMKPELSTAPSGYTRVLQRRIEGKLAQNPGIKRELQQLFDSGLTPDEFNAKALPIFKELGIAEFPTVGAVDPYKYMASTATMPGPREFSSDLEREGLRSGQIDTQELITRGLNATGETVMPNVFKPTEPVRTGGKADGNKEPFVVGQSQRSGSIDIDEFLDRAKPDIEAIQRRTGRPYEVIAQDVRAGIEGTRAAGSAKSKAYDSLIGQITAKYSPQTDTADAGTVGGARSFTGVIPDLSDSAERAAFANVVGRQIGKQEAGSYLGSLLKKDQTTRLNAITNAALEGGIDKDKAINMGRFIESVASVYSSASDANRTAISNGFTKLIELTTALDKPELGVPDDVKADVFKKATSLFEGAISGAGNAGAGKTITSLRSGVDSLANLTDKGMVSFLLSGRPYSEWLTTKKRLAGADTTNFRTLDKTQVSDVEQQLVKQVMGAARGIVLERMQKAFSEKYKGTPIGNKQAIVTEFMTELLKADTDIPILRQLQDQVLSVVKNMQLGKELGSGNKRAIDLVSALDTGSQLSKTGSVFDPVTGERVTRPAQSLAARLDLTNILESVLKLDWRGIGNTRFEPEQTVDPKTGKRNLPAQVTQDFDSNMRAAIDAIKSRNWGELGFRLEAYSPGDNLEKLLPATTIEPKARGGVLGSETEYNKTNALRGAIVRNLQRIVGADIVIKVGPRTFDSPQAAQDFIDKETVKLENSKLYDDDKKRALISKLVPEPMFRPRSTNQVAGLSDAVLNFKNDKTTQLVDTAFKKILSVNPEYAANNKIKEYGFMDKVAFIAANDQVGTLRFWKDFIKFAPAARDLFSGMRGGGKNTDIVPDKLPERVQQNRAILNTQSNLAKQLAGDATRVNVGEAVSDFIKGYRRFGISPYLIDETGKTPTGYSPEGLDKLIRENPLEWQEYIKSAADIAKAYESKKLTGPLLGNFVRTAVQGTNVRKAAQILKYAPNTGGDVVKELIQVLSKIPGQSRALIGKGKTSAGVPGGTIAGFDKLEELVKTEQILPRQLSGTLLGERSQFVPEKDLFELATNAIKTMAKGFGIYDSRLRYYAPAFHDKAKAIEASSAAPAVKEARMQQALNEYLDSPAAYKGILSKISGKDALSQIRRVRALVALAEQANIGRPAQKNRGRQNPTADRAIQNVEAGKETTGTELGEGKGPSGAGYETGTGRVSRAQYVRQQFMGELSPVEWLSSVQSNIVKWNVANQRKNQVTAGQRKIITRVADELAQGKTIEQLSNSPRFEGKDREALNMALSFLRFEPGSRFDVSGLRAGSLLEGIKPAIPTPKPVKPLSSPGEDAGKPKGGRGKGLLSAVKKPMGLLTPLVAPVVQQVIEGRSALSNKVRQENAAKR